MATWLSCTEAEVTSMLIGISPSMVSIWALYPIQLSLYPLLFFLVPTSHFFGKSFIISDKLISNCFSTRVGSFLAFISPFFGRPLLLEDFAGLGGFFRGFSRASIAVESRETWWAVLFSNTFFIKVSWTIWANPDLENSKKALEKVASSGISFLLSQPQILLKVISESNRSNKIRVVGIL